MESGSIRGKYEIIKKIGEGGAADIFLAEDLSSDRKVALKIPVENHESLYDSIINEYSFAARHHHPSLLKPIEMCYESRKPILVSPYLDGLTLDKYADHLKKNSDLEKYLIHLGDIFATILECADFIHYSGYCYNDFKPANIMCRRNDDKGSEPEILLIDFNLVTPILSAPTRRGTLQYLAPEIIMGDSPSVESDIYSMGVLIYQILTGRLPYDGENSVDFINNLLDTRDIDFTEVPGQFWDGLAAMLESNPALRPSNPREAARELGVDYQFDCLSKSRVGYYLSSGDPPFARELKSRFENFITSNPRKLFYIKGYSYGSSALDFLESECNINEINCFRITGKRDDDAVKIIIDDLNASTESFQPRKALIIDDLEELSVENLRQLAGIINNHRNLSVIASTARWHHPEIKHEIFDPIRIRCGKSAAEISLRSFFKLEELNFDCNSIGRVTGGDPEQVYKVVEDLCGKLGITCRELTEYRELGDPSNSPIKNTDLYRKMYEILNKDQKELVSNLAAWGDSIPLLLLVKFEKCKHIIVQELVSSGHLIRQMDSVSFFCGGFRDYIYGLISKSFRRNYHKFWAIAAEELICDSGERLELTARHWALSGDDDLAYRYNESAAREFYRMGDYFKAIEFGRAMIEFSGGNPQRLSLGYKITGDNYKAMGYFKTAREMYFMALLLRREWNFRCSIYKRLADLYLESRRYVKAIRYAEKSLEYFKSRGDGDKAAACREIIISALWGNREFKNSACQMLIDAGMEKDRRRNLQENIANEDSQDRLFSIISKIAGDYGNSSLVIRSHNEQGNGHLLCGETDKALRCFRDALDLAEKTGQDNLIFETLMNLGYCNFSSGDLFMAIECFQNAREISEKEGNIYRKSQAELRLTDIALAMGNFALADDVLSGIEKDPIYNEDNSLKLQTGIKRFTLAHALGDLELSRIRAEALAKSSPAGVNPEQQIHAEMAVLSVQTDHPTLDTSNKIKDTVGKIEKCGSPEAAAKVKFLAAEYHDNREEYAAASGYFEEVQNTAGAPRNIRLEAAISSMAFQNLDDSVAEKIEKLFEIENFAAIAGLIPLALKATGSQGRLYLNRGRIDHYEECEQRANNYLKKLLSAAPRGYSANKYKRRLVLMRRPEIPDLNKSARSPVTTG